MQVLGDLVESIAGAILVDTSFNVDAVWRVMKPLLSPIVTPDTLILHPVSELEELCKSRGYHLNLIDESDGERQTVTIRYEVRPDYWDCKYSIPSIFLVKCWYPILFYPLSFVSLVRDM